MRTGQRHHPIIPTGRRVLVPGAQRDRAYLSIIHREPRTVASIYQTIPKNKEELGTSTRY